MIEKNNNLKELTFVVAPASDEIKSLNFKKLVKYLEEKLETSINLKYSNSYKDALLSIKDGSAKLGWLGSYAYMKLDQQNTDIEPFAVGILKGRTTSNYHSLFIVNSKSDIKKIEDLRAKSLTLSDKFSASGYEVPKYELENIGLPITDKKNYKNIYYVKNHDEAIKRVVQGSTDVAAISSINFEKWFKSNQKENKSLRVIYKSSAISGPPLVFARNLDPFLKDKIKSIILDAHNHIDLGGYGGEMERYIDIETSKTKHLESYIRPQWGWKTFALISSFVVVLSFVVIDLEINLLKLFTDSTKYLGDILGRMLPPDFSNIKNLIYSMLETIEIAILGTFIAIILSIPVGLLSARNIAPNYFVYIIARTITIFFRAIPEFIMAMILVIAIGFGAMPGVLALGFHTMGFLAKFYAEDIEHINKGPVDALKSSGASKRQIISFAVIPQIIPSFVGNNLYILDRNIRMATMLGIVGAGGIGYELQSSFRMFEYPKVSAIIIIIFITIFIIDNLSSYIRSKIL
jgi:phosphonate transport system permease protein